ncbi:hypothetical protein [Pseudomonas protegens]|uniref:hypothetical protein n=1 Tax=Pseudomonas protegens TaxID=380021 RepID=UPI00301B936A
MTTIDTRARLIELIKEHQLEHGLTKLAIHELSTRAGISRQSFNRFYSDLKPYSLGASILDLLNEDSDSALAFLEKRDREVATLQEEIKRLKAQHKKDLEQASNKHITSLMNNDIIAFNAMEVNSLLTTQSLHNESLKGKLRQMELGHTKLQMEVAASTLPGKAQGAGTGLTKDAKNFLTLALNLEKACTAYHKDKNFDHFEDAKEAEIKKIIETLNRFPDPSQIELHIFQERYISTFQTFSDRLPAQEGKLTVVAQLPWYSQEDLGVFLSDLKPVHRITIHVPFSSSEAIVAAKRKFGFRGIPEEEFLDASKAKMPQITWGFDEVRVFRVRQGD